MGSERLRSAQKADEEDCETESSISDISTAAPSTGVAIDEVEVERLVMADKAVRKLSKTLREIESLEGRDHLESNQRAKVARKAEVEMELRSAEGLAGATARDTLRRKTIAAM